MMWTNSLWNVRKCTNNRLLTKAKHSGFQIAERNQHDPRYSRCTDERLTPLFGTLFRILMLQMIVLLLVPFGLVGFAWMTDSYTRDSWLFLVPIE